MSLQILANDLASKGRYGDSVLVHMRPDEVAELQGIAMSNGGTLTTNPETGLPEAWGIGSITGSKGVLGRAAGAVGLGGVYSDISKGVSGALQGITKALAPAAPLLGFIPGVGVPLAAIVGGMKDGKNWDFKRGLMSGLQAYGLNSLMYPGPTATAAPISDAFSSAGGAFDMGGVGNAAGNFGIPETVSSGIPVAAGDYTYTASGAPAAPASVEVSSIPADGVSAAYTPPVETGAFDMSGIGGAYDAQTAGAPIFDSSAPIKDYSGIRGFDAAGERYGDAAMNLLGAAGDTALTQVTEKPLQTGTAMYSGYTALQAKKELDKQKEEAERILRERANRTAAEIAYAESVLRDYPLNYQRISASDVNKYGLAAGGLTALNAGGALPPRYLSGGGDGMSDSIPARIGGKQEARLADGEFVVPADVVSHLGNGSSNAGAKKLYAMMDRVRQARTGKTKQAPAINSNRAMPA